MPDSTAGSPALRPARTADAHRLTALARAAKASWPYPPEWLDAWREELTFTSAYLEAHTVLVAERSASDGPSVVGMVSLEAGPPPELAHLWVDPAEQGTGVGRLLVQGILAEARARGWKELEVRSDPNAVGFYERFGARPIGADAAPMPGAPDRTLPVLSLPTAPSGS